MKSLLERPQGDCELEELCDQWKDAIGDVKDYYVKWSGILEAFQNECVGVSDFRPNLRTGLARF